MTGRPNNAYVGVCSVAKCGKAEVARGWCYRHYTSNRKHGNPLYVDSVAHRAAVSIGRVRKPMRYWQGKKRPAHSAETKAKMRAAAVGVPKSAAHAANISRAVKLVWRRSLGRTPARNTRGIPTEYAGVLFRSSYEARLAKAFDALNVKWIYEPERFDLGDCTYLPDFRVPVWQCYVEVKGWFREGAQRKVALFRKLHPDKPLMVVTEPVLKMFELSVV